MFDLSEHPQITIKPRIFKSSLKINELGILCNDKPLKAAAPDRAIPYPIRTATGVAKRDTADELATVNSARAPAFPVAVVNQSTANLNKNGT